MNRTGALKIEARGEREIVTMRVFDAPRRLVFDAWTKPELLMRWFGGPREWSLTVCEIDLRVGGAYRFVTRHINGSEMGWGGIYREIAAPARLVFTERFDEHWYPGDALITIDFVEESGRTTFTTTMSYASREARDAVVKSPMEMGIAESYVRLDEFLASMQASER
jgi:uncharacterized protein YndB with AHSA1/START domain